MRFIKGLSVVVVMFAVFAAGLGMANRENRKSLELQQLQAENDALKSQVLARELEDEFELDQLEAELDQQEAATGELTSLEDVGMDIEQTNDKITLRITDEAAEVMKSEIGMILENLENLEVHCNEGFPEDLSLLVGEFAFANQFLADAKKGTELMVPSLNGDAKNRAALVLSLYAPAMQELEEVQLGAIQKAPKLGQLLNLLARGVRTMEANGLLESKKIESSYR